jgi:hypothetical protein
MAFSLRRMSDKNMLNRMISQETLPLGKKGNNGIALPLRQEYLYDISVGRFKLFYDRGR